jgi:hypothetical protein
MKKRKKITAVNMQEDEDFEGYTLYPENAVVHAQRERRYENKPDLKLTDSNINDSYKLSKPFEDPHRSE